MTFRTFRRAALATVASLVAVPAWALEEGTITIWMSADKGAKQLEEVAARFTDELGIPVVIESPEPIPDKFPQAAATGDGPDVVLWAHDRFGEWAASGLLAPIDMAPAFREGLSDVALEAVTFNGETWAWPISLEAIGLIYNKEYVPEAPATFEEIAEIETPDGVGRIMWDYNNTYFTMPLLAAGGGYAFQKKDGVFDGADTGVNNEGAVAGATYLKELIDGGVMPRGVDYGIMDTAMNKGEVAMVISGPWAWSNLDQSGIDYGVAPLPTLNGEPAVPFVGVYAAAVNAASPNKDLVKELFENYLLTDEGLTAWNSANSLGALADTSMQEAQSGDERIAATIAAAEAGTPMPSNPEMGKFWSAMEPALAAITNGQQEPKAALDGAADRILN